jgi:hypothetical protein
MRAALRTHDGPFNFPGAILLLLESRDEFHLANLVFGVFNLGLTPSARTSTNLAKPSFQVCHRKRASPHAFRRSAPI